MLQNFWNLSCKQNNMIRPFCHLFLVLGILWSGMLYAPRFTHAQQRPGITLSEIKQKIQQEKYGEAIALLTTYIQRHPEDINAYLLRAQTYEKRGQFDHALADYQRVLQLDPLNETAQEGLQRAREALRKQMARQLALLRNQVANNPDNLRLRLRYATALYKAGYYKEAAEQYAHYLKKRPPTPDVITRYLIALANAGAVEQGVKEAQRFIKMYPNDDDLWMRLGYFLLWKGAYKEAEQAFKQALSLNPSNKEAQRGLEQAQNPELLKQPYLKRIQQLQEALKKQPDRTDLRLKLIDLLLIAGRLEEAQKELEILRPTLGHTEAWQERHQRLQRLKQAATTDLLSKRIRQLQAQLAQHPDKEALRWQLIDALIQANRYWEAYEELLKLKPKYGSTRRWLKTFIVIDNGLIATTGKSPVYEIDRLMYRLQYNPQDKQTRYALVKALMRAGRFAEALQYLTETPYADPSDPAYRALLQEIQEHKRTYIAQQIKELERQLSAQPGNITLLHKLAQWYEKAGNLEKAFELYQQAIQQQPDNPEIQFAYARILYWIGLPRKALFYFEKLVRRYPDKITYKHWYLRASIAAGILTSDILEQLQQLHHLYPDSIEYLLDLTSYYLKKGDFAQAEHFLRQAATKDSGTHAQAIETLHRQLQRMQAIQRQRSLQHLLDHARIATQEKKYYEALRTYETYFKNRGIQPRGIMKEVAEVHAAAGHYTTALSILQALYQQYPEYSLLKRRGQLRYYMQDYGGAIAVLDSAQQANPRDVEVQLLLARSYLAIKDFARAKVLLDALAPLAQTSPLLSQTYEELSTQLLTLQGSSYDYASVITPVSELVRGAGSGSEYLRWSKGLQAQVTLPWSAVLIGGITSHFIRGTRLITPYAPYVREKTNQIILGGFIDLTPPVSSVKAPYTNRLQLETGIFDYEGGRTVGYSSLFYHRHEPEQYTLSIGIRSSEGTIDLWTPAGAEQGIRLNQLQIRGNSAYLMPDSALVLTLTTQLNWVTAHSATQANYGIQVQVDGGYTVLPFTRLGLTYYHLSYRYRTNYYFSPANYQTYDIWLEYEKEARHQYYFRIRGSIGIVTRSGGFVTRHLEMDWIRRWTRHLSTGINLRVGQSARTLGSASAPLLEQYNTFIFSGALYWTL